MIAAAAEEGWIATEPPVDVGERTARLVAVARGAGPDAIFVLTAEGRTVGCAGLHATETDGVAYLGMAVLPEHRGLGGGRALLDALVAHAADVGIERLELEVFADNRRAISLYESAGFAHEGAGRDFPRRDGSRRRSLLMSMRLRPLRGTGYHQDR